MSSSLSTTTTTAAMSHQMDEQQQSLVNDSLFHAKNVSEKKQIIDAFVKLYDNRCAGELKNHSAAASASSSSTSKSAHNGNGNNKGLKFDQTVETSLINPHHRSVSVGGQTSPDSEELFSEAIQFRDPLMHVSGLQNYRLNFAALHSTFKRTQLDIIAISTGRGLAWAGAYQPHVTTNASSSSSSSSISTAVSKVKLSHQPAHQDEEAEIITIDAWATYEYNRFLTFKIRQVSRLSLNKEGLIETHEDLWSFADLIQSLPLIGRLYRWSQSRIGSLFCTLMQWSYARKAGVKYQEGKLDTNTLHAVYHPIESNQITHKKRVGAASDATTTAASSAGTEGDDEGEEGSTDELEQLNTLKTSTHTASAPGGASGGKKGSAHLTHRTGEHKSGGKNRHPLSTTGEEKEKLHQNHGN